MSQPSAPAPRVTAATIAGWLKDSNRPPKGGVVTHTVAPGLDVFIYGTGPGVWRWRYRPRGMRQDGSRWPQSKVTIGTTDTHALQEARAEADVLRLRVARGEDPAADRKAAIAERQAAAAAHAARATCRDLLSPYRETLLGRGVSARHCEDEVGQIERGLGSVGLLDSLPETLAASHIERILATCPEASRPARFGALDRFLRWALRRVGSTTTTPTAHLSKHEKPRALAPRDRVLTRQEIAAVLIAIEAHETPVVRDLLAFLVSTPCREGEAAAMRWADIDLAAASWEQPQSKNGLRHRFPLNERAMSILRSRRLAEGGDPDPRRLVFTAPLSGGIFSGWSNAKRSVDGRAQIAPWRLHDLRRAFATLMADAGFDDGLIDMTLNHVGSRTRSKVTRIYNLAQRWGEREHLLRAWCRLLDELSGNGAGDHSGADVVPFQPGAAPVVRSLSA